MRLSLTIILILFLSSCSEKQGVDYQTGILNCEEIIAQRQAEHPGALIGVDPDCLIGAKIPEFKTITINGKKIDKTYFQGKPTVINMWFVNCPPCVAEIPGLNQIVEQYGKDKINYLAISKDDAATVSTFLEEHPWNFDHVVAGKELIENVFMSKWAYLLTLILNKDGVIVKAFKGGKTDATASEEIKNKIIPELEKQLGSS